jgi:hypothetical protein
VRQSLGRDVSAGANQNLSINIVEPGALYGSRANQLDVRVATILRFGRTEANVGIDPYNALNSSAVPRVEQQLRRVAAADRDLPAATRIRSQGRSGGDLTTWR